MVGQITGKMFDHPIEKDCVSDLSDPGSCQIGPVRQDAGPENAAIQNLAALQWSVFATDGICFLFHSFRESGLQEFENLRTAQAAV